ncbi:Hypothetical predicted protein [Podarcis lilfordi]|uniref:Uncharacterized protein n=1 Tax=Podarcis lilfordi TaxID=74358 RepID=A0AA35P1T2_9SAUR|nr:Hypothetical predicted protein [Podarcis lilfordi]
MGSRSLTSSFLGSAKKEISASWHWQIMHSERGVWENICESAQRHLEMLYCDVHSSEIKVFERDGSKGKVRFQDVAMYPFGPYCKIWINGRNSQRQSPEECS